MKKGDKIVVHKVQFPTNHPEGEDEFKILTITKVRNDVPCMWGGNTKYTGYKAKDAEGRVYSQYWNSYPSDAMCPTKGWSPEADNDCMWYDVQQVTLTQTLTGKPKWLKGEFAKIIHWCSDHSELHYGECFQCERERKYPDTKEKYKKQRSIAGGW
jgi:hypothetical protein